MGMIPPATSRDFARPDLVLCDLCNQCTVDLCSRLFLMIPWTIAWPARCSCETRDPLVHLGPLLSQATGSSLQAIHPYLLGGAPSVALLDLWPIWDLPRRRSPPWKNVWVNWNNLWESSRLISRSRASCHVPPLAQMGKAWIPSIKICVNSKKTLNPLQRNMPTSKKTSPSNSKMLRTRLEIMDEELLLWSSPSRRSSPT